MDADMLSAAQQAVVAAQSSAQAAWWGVFVNACVVAAAVGAAAYQDHRVSARLRDSDRKREQRARNVLQRSYRALDEAAAIFHAADGTDGGRDIAEATKGLEQALRLVRLYMGMDLSVDLHSALVEAETGLAASLPSLIDAARERSQGHYNNALRNGFIDGRRDAVDRAIKQLG